MRGEKGGNDGVYFGSRVETRVQEQDIIREGDSEEVRKLLNFIRSTARTSKEIALFMGNEHSEGGVIKLLDGLGRERVHIFDGPTGRTYKAVVMKQIVKR